MTDDKPKEERKPIIPNKLVPPPEAVARMKQVQNNVKPSNPIASFCKTFFGEGF